MLNSYRVWVKRNSSWLSAVEGVAFSVTWLLPDRFADSEVKLEAVNSLLGLVSVLHSSLLVDPARSQPGNTISWCLVAIQQVEALVELLAVHFTKDSGDENKKYNALVALEAVKVLLRLLLLHARGGRLLLDGGTCLPGSSRGPGCTLDQQHRVQEVHDAFARFRARHNLPSHPREQGEPYSNSSIQADVRTCAGSAAAAAAAQRWAPGQVGVLPGATCSIQPGRSVCGLSSWQSGHKGYTGAWCIVAGELLHVLRPLVYVGLLRQRGRRCWRPYVTSLALELASLQLTQLGGRSEAYARRLKQGGMHGSAALGSKEGGVALLSAAGHMEVWTDVEQQELTRRKLLLLYYLIRSPMYELATQRAVLRTQGVLAYVPLVRMLVDKAVEILEGIQHYYTYTAAS